MCGSCLPKIMSSSALDIAHAIERVVVRAFREGAFVNVGRVEACGRPHVRIHRGAEGECPPMQIPIAPSWPVQSGATEMIEHRRRISIVAGELLSSSSARSRDPPPPGHTPARCRPAQTRDKSPAPRRRNHAPRDTPQSDGWAQSYERSPNKTAARDICRFSRTKMHVRIGPKLVFS